MGLTMVNYSETNVYSGLLDREVLLQVHNITEETGETISMVTHDSLNSLANDNNVTYEYSLKACSLEHAVVECRASLNENTVTGIGETVTSKLTGISKTIPTQMAYKRAFDAAITSLFRLPYKFYSEIQLNEPETVVPKHMDTQASVAADSTSVTSVSVSETESAENYENITDNVIPDNPVTDNEDSGADTPVLFSKALAGQTFKDIKPGAEWLEWLYSDTTEELMQGKKKEIYENFTQFKNYLKKKGK